MSWQLITIFLVINFRYMWGRKTIYLSPDYYFYTCFTVYYWLKFNSVLYKMMVSFLSALLVNDPNINENRKNVHLRKIVKV